MDYANGFCNIIKSKSEIIKLGLILCIVLFIGSYKLTESPRTWFDEGFIIQSAHNFYETGKLAIRISPKEVVGSTVWFSTGYPIVAPIALSMAVFGHSLVAARAVMVMVLICFVLICYLLAKELWGPSVAFLSSVLVATFPPLYGNGKNVLGELPGLLFLFLFLYLSEQLIRKEQSNVLYVITGCTLGLCVFTKSIFFTVPVAALVGAYFYRKEIFTNKRGLALFLLSFCIMAFLWVFTQVYSTDSFRSALTDLANPYAAESIWSIVLLNVKRFFTELTPIYFLLLMIGWFFASIIRKHRQIGQLSFSEIVFSVFAILTFLAYFRIVGWYRYFFPAHVVMLFLLPAALSYLSSGWKETKYVGLVGRGCLAIVFILVSIQSYQLLFRSFVAGYYQSHDTEIVSSYFSRIPPEKSIFILNAPELATFIKGENYYQYIDMTETIKIGSSALDAVKKGIPDLCITYAGSDKLPLNFLNNYKQKDIVGRYIVYDKVGI